MKSSLKGSKNILGDTEGWISNLEDKVVEIIQSRQQKEMRIKKKMVKGISGTTSRILHLHYRSLRGEERKWLETYLKK